MVAGYVGGRRAGAPWKAVVASAIPVILIFGMSASYDAGYGRSQIDFLSRLPASIAAAVGSAVPFLQPYTTFVVDYLTTFIEALQKLFGMGSNGYLVTIAFAYIGGIVGDQTRREIGSKSSGATSVNIVQPILGRFHRGDRDDEDDEPVRVHRPRPSVRGRPAGFSQYRKLPAQVIATRHALPPARRHPREDPEPIHEVEASRPAHRPRESPQATQRFVERALSNYDRPRHTRHPRD